MKSSDLPADVDPEKHREQLRDRYGSVSKVASHDQLVVEHGRDTGYDQSKLKSLPEGAYLGVSCGVPLEAADLQPGERVLDLGSGGGFDCFLAAEEVGPDGHVIGVDMTPEMVEQAHHNARESHFDTVSFTFGTMEQLPLADQIIDVIISNCVINLSPEKPRVFNEAFRVLTEGGRLAIADKVALVPLPDSVRKEQLTSGCVGGAATIDALEEMLQTAGFEEIRIEPDDPPERWPNTWDDDRNVDEYVVSATIQATKP